MNQKCQPFGCCVSADVSKEKVQPRSYKAKRKASERATRSNGSPTTQRCAILCRDRTGRPVRHGRGAPAIGMGVVANIIHPRRDDRFDRAPPPRIHDGEIRLASAVPSQLIRDGRARARESSMRMSIPFFLLPYVLG